MGQLVKAYRDGKFAEIDEAEVDYSIPSMSRVFGYNINAIPLQSNVPGTRLFYGARFYNQSPPIINGEEPWVQNGDPDNPGQSFDQRLGHLVGAVFADTEGVVDRVTDSEIFLKTADGERSIPFYKNLPFNRKTAFRQRPLVAPGMQVTTGQPLIGSNFTNDSGTMTMGVNARVAVVPYKGYTMDDSIVLSQRFANKLRSQHNYEYGLVEAQGVKTGLNHFKGIFPKFYTNEQLGSMDESGVIQPGTVVREGDPLILATSPKRITAKATQSGKVTALLRASRKDNSVVWDHQDEGVVSDVVKTKDGWKVYVDTESPVRTGDKIVFRAGQKGISSLVIPDDEMPETEDGQKLDILFNQLGLNSRVNAATFYEMLLGKVAAAKGTPIKVPSFTPDSWEDVVTEVMGESGIEPKERVYDPKLGAFLDEPVTVGNAYVLKLSHTSEGKSSYRGKGAYDIDMLPLKGSADAAHAKRFSGLEVGAGLSAGIYDIMRDKASLTGTSNPEFWKDYRAGYTPRYPGQPFAYDKLKALMTGAGLFIRNMKDGDGRPVERIGFLSRKDVDALRPFEITRAESVDISKGGIDHKDGGLFDPAILSGRKWGVVRTPFPLLNPAAENEARLLLGLTKKEFREVLEGKREI